MADHGSYGLGPRLDIQQLLSEAQHRWLRPAEICEILRNYQTFQISSEPPNRPPSGSLFLFDRKVLRYFRKDGHNWRKKKDGKTVKEAHEKLKVGSVDVLHCYYAHGEENENFQRRSYWMLEPDLMHIVFVHYLEVKGNRTSTGGIRENNEVLSNSVSGTPSRNMETASPTSTLSSLCEDADSGDSRQASSSSQAYTEMAFGSAYVMNKQDSTLSNPYYVDSSAGNQQGWTSFPSLDVDGVRESDSQKPVDLETWEDIYERSMAGYVPYHASFNQSNPDTFGIIAEHKRTEGNTSAIDAVVRDQLRCQPHQSNLQIPIEDEGSSQLPKWPVGLAPYPAIEANFDMGTLDQRKYGTVLQNDLEPLYGHVQQNEHLAEENLQAQLRGAESDYVPKSSPCTDMRMEGNIGLSLPVRKSLLDAEERLKKVDSFSRWISKELEEVEDLQMQSSSNISWSTVGCENVVDGSSLSPSLSQDQLFSIIDFSPTWAFTDSDTEVLVIGTFLKSKQEVTKCSWSCMFGEVEVTAEILVDGVLCCHAPPHIGGQVPFYVTCSNRLACSEVREFDYRTGTKRDVNITEIDGVSANEVDMHLRLERLLSQKSSGLGIHIFEDVKEKRKLVSKLILLKEEDEFNCSDKAYGTEQLLQGNITEKLYSWLIHKVTEDGKGPNVLDDEGQGVIHLAAALGYHWAIKPIYAAGVSINYRDVNGWTALHWAAYYGREKTVGVLISLGADTRALTDPSPEYTLGRTAADLASGNGHKGISGFIAESSLTSYLEHLTMNDVKDNGASEADRTRPVQTASHRSATPVDDGDVPDALSLKDSLTAVCNATQAADRIHQVFRMQSFQWKQLSQSADDGFDMADERAISFLASKSRKPLVHAAAVQIQKKFRGWKKRKEFLLIRQRIVKIQAHVRGHQARKRYGSIIWSVGILEKIILRWRRKGSGLRGFRRDTIAKQSELGCTPSEEDDYDFLKEGRKQTEERLQKALNRVKSMVQYPEARAQYRRLLTAVEGFHEHKASNMEMSSTEEVAYGDDDLIDIETLLDDEAFMTETFE